MRLSIAAHRAPRRSLRYVSFFLLVYWTDNQQDALLTPFRVLFSKAALRIYLNIILFSGATLLLVGISGIAYTIFYMNFIPTVGVDRVVHLQHE